MSKSQRKAKQKRTRTDLKIAAKALVNPNAILLPFYARELWKPHRYKVIYGGRGGARSWTVARMLLLKAAQKPIRILCAREIQSSIKDSVHQLLRDQIELMHLKGFLVTDREIRHVNGSLFIFGGLRHNATKIKSLEGIDICWVEEAERITKESWSILIPTIRKVGSEIWVTFNPDQETDATYTRFVVHPPKDVYALKVNSHDNPWLSDELREEREYAYATDAESADHVWGGNIRRFSDAQILRNKWVVQEFTVPTDIDRDGQVIPLWAGPYQGIDFGFASDPAACVRLWIHGDVLYVEQELWKLHLELDDIADTAEQCIPAFADYVIRADSSRPDSISYLRRHGMPQIIGAKKHAGSVNEGIAHLRSYKQIIIHPRCKHFIEECKAYAYKVDIHSGDVLPIIVDKHNHLMDATRYALDPLIKPKVNAGFMFSSASPSRICPVCESYLPDSGECVHCGALVDDNGQLIDATNHDISPAAKEVYALMAPPVIVHTNGNGNGNGHHHDAPALESVAPKPSRFTGLNG